MKKIIYVLTGLSLMILGGVGVVNASALTEQSTAKVQFEWSSRLAISISGTGCSNSDGCALSIAELGPGLSKDSNELTIGVSANYYGGYTLSASVGSASNKSSNLTHSDGNATFESLATTANASSLTAGKWGYKIATSTDGTSYGSYSSYSGLPYGYDNSGTQVGNIKTLTSTSGADGVTSTKFKIGAYADTTQLSGDYTNTINFYIVTNAPAA